jgi:NitT/TauT family transport system substrate-binding protein
VFVALLLVPALLLAAGPAAAQAVKVKLGSSLSPPSLDSLTPYVAIEQGFFKKLGLDVQVVEFRGDATHTKALLAGEIDASINMGATNGIVAASKGAKLKLFMVPQSVTPYHFVARREAGTTLQALAGKTVAVSSIGAISYHIPRIVFERSGIDPEKMKYIAVGSPADRFKALVAGKIDATVVTNVEAAKLAQYPDIVVLVQVPKVVPEIPYEFGMAREEYIEKNPDTMYKLTKGLIEANRWAASNRAGVLEIGKKILKEEPVEVLGKAYDMFDPGIWNPNGDLSEASYKYTVDFLLKVGYMKEPVPYDKFFDRRFVDRVLKELGRM